MKKLLLAFLFIVLFSSITLADALFHIGTMTGTVSQSEDELRGAERLIKEYGQVSDGGMISHLTWPDSFMTEMETTTSQIAGWVDDPLVNAMLSKAQFHEQLKVLEVTPLKEGESFKCHLY